MAGIGELAVFVTANTKKAQANLRSFGERVKKTSTVVKSAAKTFGRLGLALGAAGLGAAATGMAALAASTKQAFSAIDDLAKTGDMLGIMPDKLAGLRLAAEEAGVAVSVLDNGLKRMIDGVSDATLGKGEAKGALSELGLDPKTLNQMAPDEKLKEIADAFSNVTNEADRLRLATDLFGMRGASMINMLKNGAGALDEAQQAAEMLGLSVDRFDASRVEAANDALGRVKSLLVGVGRVIAVEVAPFITAAAKSMTDWVASAGGLQAKMNSFGKVMRKVAGFVMDMGEMIKLAFMAIQLAITKVIAVAANAIDALAGQLVRLSDATGIAKGIAEGLKNATSAVAGSFDAQVDELGSKLQDAWLAPPPSAKLEQWTDSIAAAAEESRKKYNEGLQAKEDAKKTAFAQESFTASMGTALGKVGAFVGKMMGKNAAKEIEQAAPLQSARAGTREEYAIRAQMNNQQVEIQQKQLAEQEATRQAVVDTGEMIGEAIGGLAAELAGGNIGIIGI